MPRALEVQTLYTTPLDTNDVLPWRRVDDACTADFAEIAV